MVTRKEAIVSARKAKAARKASGTTSRDVRAKNQANQKPTYTPTPQERRQQMPSYSKFPRPTSGLDESKRFTDYYVGDQKTTSDPDSPTYLDVGIHSYYEQNNPFEGMTGEERQAIGKQNQQALLNQYGTIADRTEATRKTGSKTADEFVNNLQVGLGWNPDNFDTTQRGRIAPVTTEDATRYKQRAYDRAVEGAKRSTQQWGRQDPKVTAESMANTIDNIMAIKIDTTGAANEQEEQAMIEAGEAARRDALESGSSVGMSMGARSIQRAASAALQKFKGQRAAQTQKGIAADQMGQFGRDTAASQDEPQVNPESVLGDATLDAIIQQNPELAGNASIYKAILGLGADNSGQANSVYSGGVKGAMQSFNDVTDQIQTSRDRTDAFFDTLKQDAERDRIRRQDFAKEQAAIQQDELEFTFMQQARDEREKKRETIDRMTATLALGGGFGSGQGVNAINEAERKIDEHLSDLRYAYGIDKRKILSGFKADYMNAEMMYDSAVSKANSEYLASIEALDSREFSARDTLRTEKQRLDENRFAAHETARKENANLKLTAINKMVTDADALRSTQNANTEKARTFLLDTFKNTEAGSSLRKFAVDELKALGVDTSKINVNEVTPETFKNLREAAQEAKYSPNQFMDEKKRKMMSAGSTIITSKLAVAAQEMKLDELHGYIANNELGKAQELLEGVVINKMNGSQYDTYIQRKSIVDNTDGLLKDLALVQNTKKGAKIEGILKDIYGGENGVNSRLKEKAVDGKRVTYLEPDDFNWYTTKWQDVRRALGKDPDPQLQSILARVENIASLVINERYGAAVSEGEMDRAKQYIAMSGNTLGEMIIKLDEFSKVTAGQNANALGVPIFGKDFNRANATLPEVQNSMDTIFGEFEAQTQSQFEGDYKSDVFDGRKVTLAPRAFDAFKYANEDFKKEYGIDIRIGSVADSTLRNQADTIQRMAVKHGVEFNASNPDETAGVLRGLGHQVANVGYSKHEKGLAVDLYPDTIEIGGKTYTGHEYITLVKPFLEKYGLKQANHKGIDPGNFEYTT